MNIIISPSPELLGERAACRAAESLNRAIAEKGAARVLFSTGASQFEMFKALVKQEVDWKRVTMFHLDEYCGLPEDHPASFRKYLMERFISQVSIGACHLVDGSEAGIEALNAAVTEAPIDLGLIGVGENGHVAFNDPPADFETEEPYIVVTLDEACKRQQVREGWFASVEDVPKTAVTMSVRQIMKCAEIISCVPHAVKADAVAAMVNGPLSNMVPASILKTHPNVSLYLDKESSAKIKRFNGEP